ncbi:hypothetical protein KQI15_01625 [Intestinimonas butyriciproducens]|jgi:hypothetical protein|uniref:hypothetical protein n=1 Tax=Intestinimonas butyriciproducens TaxID=1297617 RepID=UPI001C107E6B|nr:hypothetical protein [Intestinimonas butyriciproducens]MBU5228740.1 hypothetical protein [Intestinimonas butyriciproducens]
MEPEQISPLQAKTHGIENSEMPPCGQDIIKAILIAKQETSLSHVPVKPGRCLAQPVLFMGKIRRLLYAVQY